MSPIAEVVSLDLRQYTLRHVGPKAVVFPDTPGRSFTVLNRSDMVARPLPSANIPNSVDFVQGKWTGRLYDAGDGNIVFPNREASDGVPWRNRFDPTNKLQWIEVYLDEYLEACLCVTKVTPDRNQVLVEGYDGFQLLKTAYERDWVTVQSPRDVIERGTMVWVPTTTDNFPAGALSAQWTPTVSVGGTATIGASGGLVLTAPGVSADAAVDTANVSVPANTNVWRATIAFTAAQSVLNTSTSQLSVGVTESTVGGPDLYGLILGQFNGGMDFGPSYQGFGHLALASQATYTMVIESDGEWVWGFVNGQLVGVGRRVDTYATALSVHIELGNSGAVASSVMVAGVLVETLQPFLQRGSDKGDYALPGSAITYPAVGLHARYSNNLDLPQLGDKLRKMHAPSRTIAFAGSGTSEYANQLDAGINGQSNPTPGAASSGWSCIWFGAIYLKLSAGNYTFTMNLQSSAANQAVRVYVGKTKYGDQLVDHWNWGNAGSAIYTFTVSASALAGTLPYGAGTVQRDGWYPIKVEFAVGSTAEIAPVLRLTNSPAAYTDPGGTAIASGAQSTIVPSTSLSPLGMVDQRHQGVSHFDLVQKNAIAFGYQIALEPQQLESGLFPGVLAPRIREGHDTDIVIEPDDSQRKEGMINYSSAVDGTDQITSLMGNGAGFQNGTQGQLQAVAYDPPTLQNALFDIQGWQDAADASFVSLLGAILNSELGLRLVPWSLVSGDPIGRERLSYTWPLPGSVQQMRWRPGDGVRILAPDINVQDTTPRQILVVTRNIHPNGAMSTQVGFAARPKSGVYANRKALAAALRPQRNYQKQLVNLTGNQVQGNIAAGGTGAVSILNTMNTDLIVRARLRVVYNGGGANSFDVLVNNVNVTGTLNGPWSVVPVNLDIGAVAAPDGLGQFYAAVKNNTGGTLQFNYQLFVDVLR